MFITNKLRHAVSGILIAAVLGYGVSVHAAIDAPHNQCNNITCSSCHDLSLADSPLLAGSDINNFCTANCHSALTAPYTDTSAPIAKTHEDKICTDCHNPHIQGQKFWKNADGSDYFLAEGQIDSYTYNSGPKTTTINYSGGTFHSGWTVATITDKSSSQRRPILLPNIKKLGWSFPVTAMDATTITVKGNLTPVYTYTGTPTNFAIIMGQLLNQYIDTNDDGTKETEIKFFDHGGDCSWSYAYDESSTGTDPSPNGVCQACHTTTGHWKNDGTLADHFNTVMTCTHCHPHSNGFAYGYNADDPGCDDCHGHDNGFGGDTYYGTTQSHSSHMENDSDDLKGPGIGCSGCHDTDYFPYFADSETSLADTTVCDNCHSSGGAFDGVAMAKAGWDAGIYKADGTALNAGKETWCASCHDSTPAYSRKILTEAVVDNGDASYVGTWGLATDDPKDPNQFYGADFNYHAAGTGANTATWNFPAGFTSGTYNVYARWNVYSNRATNAYYTINRSGGSDVVGSINMQRDGGKWNLLGSFSFTAGSGSVVLNDNANGIVIADAIRFLKSDSVGTYAPNVVGDNATYGFYVTGHNMNCLACHDQKKTHIDHEHRTYEVVEATSQAVNSYEDGYRLREVNGERPMIIPQAVNSCTRTPSHYLLCMKCHDSAPLLSSTRSGTNLWKEATQKNWHRGHLDMYNQRIWDSDWDAVMGNPNNESLDSVPSCPTCHNVHGSPTPAMTRHGELMTMPGSPSKVPSFNFGYLSAVETRDPGITSAFPDSVGIALTFGSYPESNNYNGICGHCHGGTFYVYRTPVDVPKPSNPKVLLPKPIPSNVANNGASPVLLTAVAVDPDGGLSSVEIDLSALGGSATQAMYDDGTNGDVTAADEIYSYLLSGTNVGVGNKVLTVTAEDSDNNTATGEITLAVHDIAGSYIVDNTEAAFTLCEWTNWSTSTTFFGMDFQYIGAGSGNHTATWAVPSNLPGGAYNVYVQWSSYTNRATNVYYTVNHSGGSNIVGPYDQKSNGGTWVLLGSFTFNAGEGSVVLTDNANGVVTADAIKWVPQP